MQKTNQTEFRAEKVIKKKGDKPYIKWKGHDNSFNSWIDKKIWCRIKWFNIFLNHINVFLEIKRVELDLPNYATTASLKRVSGVDTSNLAAKSDLVSLKADIDKTDVEKLKTVPADLSNLSNVLDNR